MKRFEGKIDSVEMVKCEACGQFHKVTECEIVTIKIVKGKDCALGAGAIFTPPVRAEIPKVEPVNVDATVDKSVVIPPGAPRPKRNIIPPGILSVMTPHDRPGHAEEHRMG